MNIMIVGVSGFIGRHLYQALSQQGHQLIGCSRQQVCYIRWQFCDFSQSVEDWENQLQTCDVVINAAGIYQQTDRQSFSQVHELGPKRLFDACRKHKIRVIQLSAIGAEKDEPATDFLKSKRSADQYLLAQDLANVVLYPGIALGEQGRSTRQLSLLARLLWIPLVFGKEKVLPLISIQQLTDRIVAIINNWPSTKQAQVLIAKPETMEHLLNNLRLWMGLKNKSAKGRFFYFPTSLIKRAVNLFPGIAVGAFNKQSIDMLSAYSNETYVAITNETASESLLINKARKRFNKDLRLRMLFYINLLTLGVIWIISGLSSLINVELSRELIVLIGIKGVIGDVIIYAAAVGDILLGFFLWVPRLRHWVIYMQIGVMVIYSLIISIFVPLFWLHPFAPIIKNLAMLVLALYLLIEEKE